ncbi:MAG TPA: hypothetical protein VJT31_17980 [Rugosimonospora sp.]|nr:hypothetical protein [Rugosimonospora sp.]
MSTRETVAYLILSAGLLAMPVGAFGLLDALGETRPRVRRTLALIGVYALGVLLCAFALVVAGRWYLGAPLVLMLIPAETAVRKLGGLRRRAKLSHFR